MSRHFRLRTYQRIVHCTSCYYLSEDFLGKGIVWDISPGGWRMQGDHHVTLGMKLTLRMEQAGDKLPLEIDEAIVEWVNGTNFGVRITKISRPATRRLGRIVGRHLHEGSHSQR